ncbi:MAG: Maf family protein [Conexibacter sp.]
MTRLVLASRSPQRRAILEQLGVAFEVVVPDVAELSDGDPVAVAVENARRKALAIRSAVTSRPIRERSDRTSASEVVLGVDTVVTLDGAVYGKPTDARDARAMLAALGGRWHEVVSGIAVAEGGELRSASATTRVRFRPLTPELLDWYVATGEWQERAGAYAIQGRGAALVAELAGDYLNVVGLPVAALLELLPGILQRGAGTLR